MFPVNKTHKTHEERRHCQQQPQQTQVHTVRSYQPKVRQHSEVDELNNETNQVRKDIQKT